MSRHVMFLEHVPFFSISTSTHDMTKSDLIRIDHFSDNTDNLSSPVLCTTDTDSPSVSSPSIPITHFPLHYSHRFQTVTSADTGTSLLNPSATQAPSETVDPHPRYPQRTRKSTQLPDFSYSCYSDSFSTFLASIHSLSEPSSYKEAVLDPHWQQAMVDELFALHKTYTWDLIALNLKQMRGDGAGSLVWPTQSRLLSLINNSIAAVQIRHRHSHPTVVVGAQQRSKCPSLEERYQRKATKYWNDFYKRHNNKFFKDRHYLDKDWGHFFSDDSFSPNGKVLFEVGCGAGNTIFPLVAAYHKLYVHACDTSPHAIELVKMKACESFSGADLSALMNEAAMAAWEEKLTAMKSCPLTTIKITHFERALSKITPSVSNQQRQRYQNLSESLKAV
ncbi:hypothetical protein EZV62_003421 [Acer yangbiense]|uniref:AAA ATPase AAA+ lid domain-containing protein n=1 Tax=Acer yangbiense TaxID=1000413 RepID=A0A5C7IIZ9_9ROSI|nr:hypothetical protein EZV62_003421 [Acer yangbiense]